MGVDLVRRVTLGALPVPRAQKMAQATHAVKSMGPPAFYLGIDCEKDRQDQWRAGCKKRLMEAIKRAEHAL